MENELQLEIGNEEAEKLKPSKVKILAMKIKEEGKLKKGKILKCQCLHPDSKEPIHISAVKYENKGKLESAGLWLNLDKSNKLLKNSALAVFLRVNGCSKIEDLRNKDVETTTDEKGYLCFKAY